MDYEKVFSDLIQEDNDDVAAAAAIKNSGGGGGGCGVISKFLLRVNSEVA